VTILSVIARKAVRHERGTGVPCWACLGAQRLGKLTLPVIVREERFISLLTTTTLGVQHGTAAAKHYALSGKLQRLE
jgi:hypothetical protein